MLKKIKTCAKQLFLRPLTDHLSERIAKDLQVEPLVVDAITFRKNGSESDVFDGIINGYIRLTELDIKNIINIEFDWKISTIAHEISHLYHYRHNKSLLEKTRRLLDAIKLYNEETCSEEDQVEFIANYADTALQLALARESFAYSYQWYNTMISFTEDKLKQSPLFSYSYDHDLKTGKLDQQMLNEDFQSIQADDLLLNEKNWREFESKQKAEKTQENPDNAKPVNDYKHNIIIYLYKKIYLIYQTYGELVLADLDDPLKVEHSCIEKSPEGLVLKVSVIPNLVSKEEVLERVRKRFSMDLDEITQDAIRAYNLGENAFYNLVKTESERLLSGR